MRKAVASIAQRFRDWFRGWPDPEKGVGVQEMDLWPDLDPPWGEFPEHPLANKGPRIVGHVDPCGSEAEGDLWLEIPWRQFARSEYGDAGVPPNMPEIDQREHAVEKIFEIAEKIDREGWPSYWSWFAPPKMSEIEWDPGYMNDQTGTHSGLDDVPWEAESLNEWMNRFKSTEYQQISETSPFTRYESPVVTRVDCTHPGSVDFYVPYQRTDHAVCPYCLAKWQEGALAQLCCYQIKALYWKAIEWGDRHSEMRRLEFVPWELHKTLPLT